MSTNTGYVVIKKSYHCFCLSYYQYKLEIWKKSISSFVYVDIQKQILYLLLDNYFLIIFNGSLIFLDNYTHHGLF